MSETQPGEGSPTITITSGMAFAKPAHAWSPVNSHKNPTGSLRWSKPHGSTVPKRWCQGWLRCSCPLYSASFPASLCEICPQTGCGGLAHRLFLMVWGKLLPTKVLPHLTVVGPKSPSWGAGIVSACHVGQSVWESWSFPRRVSWPARSLQSVGETRPQCLRNCIYGVVKCCGWKEPEHLVAQDKGCNYQVILN